MTGKAWKDHLQSWEGTVTDMVAVLEAAVEEESWAGAAPNVRLLRHYTQLGVLDRPERRGKEAFYTQRQLIQYMVARWLLSDGWMLVKIAEVTATRSDTELLALLPGAPLNPAQALIQRFKTSASSRSVTARQTQLLQQRAQLQQALPEMGNTDGVVQRRERTELRLADWCHVLIDTDRLSALSSEEATRLGKSLTAALNEASRSPIRSTASKHRRMKSKKKR